MSTPTVSTILEKLRHCTSPQHKLNLNVPKAKPQFVLKHTLHGHTKSVTAVKFSPDGTRLATGGADGVVCIYNLAGEMLGELCGAHTLGINDLAWSPCSNYIVTASDDAFAIVWNSHLFLPLRVLRAHTHSVLCCVFSPEGAMIATGSADETVCLWDTRTGACLRHLDAHTAPVSALAFSHDSHLLLSGSYDGTARAWDTTFCTCRATLALNKVVPVTSLSFAPNDEFVLATHLDGVSRVWHLPSRMCVRVLVGALHKQYAVRSTFMQPSLSKNPYFRGRIRCLSGSEDGGFCVWDIENKMLLRKVKAHNDVCIAVDAHPYLGLVASGGLERDPTVRVWSCEPTWAEVALRQAADRQEEEGGMGGATREGERGESQEEGVVSGASGDVSMSDVVGGDKQSKTIPQAHDGVPASTSSTGTAMGVRTHGARSSMGDGGEIQLRRVLGLGNLPTVPGTTTAPGAGMSAGATGVSKSAERKEGSGKKDSVRRQATGGEGKQRKSSRYKRDESTTSRAAPGATGAGAVGDDGGVDVAGVGGSVANEDKDKERRKERVKHDGQIGEQEEGEAEGRESHEGDVEAKTSGKVPAQSSTSTSTAGVGTGTAPFEAVWEGEGRALMHDYEEDGDREVRAKNRANARR